MSCPTKCIRVLRAITLASCAVLCFAALAAADTCLQVGAWQQPAASEASPLRTRDVIARLTGRRVILLGESHDQAEHHRWQLHVIAVLHAHEPDLVLGFEMFPRSVQPALDDWTAGRLSERQFLAATRWNEVWSLDPKLYMPLFDFARMHRIPMVALNVERALVRRTRNEGWTAVPLEQREGVGDPAPADAVYLNMLFESFAMHQEADQKENDAKPDGAAAAKADLRDPHFVRFVESMQLWDRAMAEAIAAKARSKQALVVGIMGSGHLRNGFGVPHQLHDLGIDDFAVLLPWEANERCDDLVAGLADYVFALHTADEPGQSRPRLGVALDQNDEGVAIREVVKGSVAEEAGAQAGDVIRVMAGVTVTQSADVVQIVQRQAPGTWLPMTVQRKGKSIELVARFPAAQ